MVVLEIKVEEVDEVDDEEESVEETEADGSPELLVELLVADPLDVPFESEEEAAELLADEWPIPTNKIEAAKADTKTIATTAATATTCAVPLLRELLVTLHAHRPATIRVMDA